MVAWSVSMQEMVMKQFIPFSDEWFERGLPLPGPLVPYRSGVACLHELEARRTQCTAPIAPSTVKMSPACAPIRTAVPALSSST